MLNAFKQQLKQLAETPEELHFEIESRVGKEKALQYIESLKNLILVMPDMVAQVRSWSNDSRIPSMEKKLHGFMLTYLYHPVDFLPESGKGLFGYLDDAYIVGSIYSRTMRCMDYDKRSTLPNLEPLTKSIHEWLAAVREVIPSECQKIDQLLQELVEGKLNTFDQLMAQQEPKGETYADNKKLSKVL